MEGRPARIAYWITTLPVAFENAAGAMWVFLPLIPGVNHSHASIAFADYIRAMLDHLGYPQYFRFILGPWQLACAATLVAPRMKRVKEWAYFGAFLNYSSAIASHAFVGDGIDVAALVPAVLVCLSWALRPTAPTGETSAWDWARAAGILILLFIGSLFWLPHLQR